MIANCADNGFNLPVWKLKDNTVTFHGIVVPFNYSEGLSEGLNILIAKAIDEGISKGISEGIKEIYLKVIEVLIKKGSLKVSQIADEIDKPAKTIERYVSFLKGIGAIEFEGSKKAGGYRVTDNLLKSNKEN